MKRVSSFPDLGRFAARCADVCGLAFILLAPARVHAQAAGTITGRVIDAASGQPIAY